jgi:hypothetical protein
LGRSRFVSSPHKLKKEHENEKATAEKKDQSYACRIVDITIPLIPTHIQRLWFAPGIRILYPLDKVIPGISNQLSIASADFSIDNLSDQWILIK